MPKKQKPPPSAEELMEKERTHLDWIRQNGTSLARTALTLYQKSGRGAFIIREQDAKPSGTVARYVPITSTLALGSGWTDVRTGELVYAYEPSHQLVIAFVYRDGTSSTYTIGFVQIGETITIEAV
jgi:hypothetical protein